MIQNPKVGDEILLHGFATEGERGRIIKISTIAIDSVYGANILVDILHRHRGEDSSTKQWVSPLEIDRVDAVTLLAEIDNQPINVVGALRLWTDCSCGDCREEFARG